jgi:hypothetical protein
MRFPASIPCIRTARLASAMAAQARALRKQGVWQPAFSA